MLVKFLVKLNEKWLFLTTGNKKEWWRKCLLNAAEEKLYKKKGLEELLNYRVHGGVARTTLVFIQIYFYSYTDLFLFYFILLLTLVYFLMFKAFAVLHRGQFSRQLLKYWNILICQTLYVNLHLFYRAFHMQSLPCVESYP